MQLEKRLCKNTTGENTTKGEKWLELLLGGDNRQEFNHIKSESKTLLFALCKYKKILRQRSSRGTVPYTLIQSAYVERDINRIHTLLNELFLEYHTTNEISEFLELMEITNTTIEEIYNRHLLQPEDNIFSHLTL